MAAGDNFTWEPNMVHPAPVIYAVEETASLTHKKHRTLVDDDGLRRFKLVFNNLTVAERNTIRAHFDDQHGNYFPFSWTSVPAYIDGGNGLGNNVTVNYMPVEEGGWKATPRLPYNFRLEVTFEAVVT